MPIRWRLTLWFALILGAILTLSGIVLYILLERYLYTELDKNLEIYSARVHGTFSSQEIPLPPDYEVIHSRLPAINEFASPGIYIQFMDVKGNVVVKSDSLGAQELPVNPSLIEKGFAGKDAIETVPAGEKDQVRIMVSPLYLNDQTLVVEVAQSLKHIDTTMGQVRWALLASIFIALILTSLSGGAIVRRALSPVSRITQTASKIAAGSNLDRRVGYSGPADEVGQLAMTFDRMIQHLDQAFQSQKQFVADASHELRSPLTVIRGNLDLLKRKLSQEDRAECLRAIEAETGRMIKIVNDLLLLAEVETGKTGYQETVALKGVLLGEFERARPLVGNRTLVIARQEDLAIKGDSYKLRQVLGNLLDNAIKYTPEGGAITLSLYRDGDRACLAVADTGIGIAPQDLAHIFDRFYRVDKARSRANGGTGLGLAIAKAIAEQHGGEITVTSEPGRGSTFTIRLKF